MRPFALSPMVKLQGKVLLNRAKVLGFTWPLTDEQLDALMHVMLPDIQAAIEADAKTKGLPMVQLRRAYMRLVIDNEGQAKK